MRHFMYNGISRGSVQSGKALLIINDLIGRILHVYNLHMYTSSLVSEAHRRTVIRDCNPRVVMRH